jgi:aminoglycoside phosphotransferase (APT) family kinase protein
MNKRYFSDDDIALIRAKYDIESSIDDALTRKLLRRRGEDYRLPDPDTLTAKLTDFLSAQINEPFEVSDVARVPGGGSKEMFSFILKRQSTEPSTPEKLILRMDPGESIAETNRLREFQIMKAIQSFVPVPEVYWVDDDGSYFGNAALICGFVSGVTKPSAPQGDGGGISGIGAGFIPETRAALFEQFLDYLVAIHSFKIDGCDLSAYQVPKIGTTEAAKWSLNHWSRVWEEDSFADHPVITIAQRWLNDNLPTTDQVCLVHNDYRNGNFLYNEETLEITAILDWETARLGDYHEDLAWILFPGFAAPDENGNPLVCGLAPKDVFIRTYEERSGNKVDKDRLTFYSILNLYKVAILGSATNARAASDRQTHLDVMMNLSTGLGYSAIAGLYELLTNQGAMQ